MRDQPLDWKKAPPVHVLNYLVLGGEKDAKSKEVCSFTSVCMSICISVCACVYAKCACMCVSVRTFVHI